MFSKRTALAAIALFVLCITAAPASDPLVRPHPQVMQPSEGGFAVSAGTRIVIPKDWPGYVRVSAEELSSSIKEACGIAPPVVEVDKPEVRKGDITVAPFDWLRQNMPWVDSAPIGINRPGPAEGYNIRIIPEHLYLAGNSERGCFMGLQTLIQIARQTKKGPDGALTIPGLLISDWPAHNWRTLQHPFGVYGNTYDRGEHRYRHITEAALLERSVRLAAYNKLTGLVVEVGTGMTYDRHPEIFVEGFPTNEKAKVREAVDLAKSLGLELVPFQNVSAMHDIWFGPYPYAVQDSDIFMQTLFDVFDETIDTFRPAHFHIGMDEDGATDFDEVALRDTPTHKKVILDCYEFLKRRGLTTLAWNDGINQLGKEQADIPRDVVVLPWYYGGDDFTPAKNYTDQGFRILCSPWSQWHEENDQFYSIYASSLKSDKVLGMAGTVWYPISSDPEGENDYRRCLVKAASAFWSPVQAGSYPRDKEYHAPAYSGLSGGASSAVKPIQIPAADLTGLISLVTGQDADHLKCESARERLVAAGTRIVPALMESMAKNPAEVSPWAEGTLRRIVRDPIGDPATMPASLEAAAVAGGKLQALSLEMLGALKDHSFIEKQSPADPEVCAAMGVSRDTRYLPALANAASTDGPARGNALIAIGKLKGLQELQALGGSWKSFSDESREAYARALAMQASEAALPVLGELLSDANWRVRFRAAMGIGATRSPKAGPYLLKVLKDKNPAVFKIGLYWCTDTRIMAPDGYFPALISRLSLDEDPEIVKPIVHALLLMWDPARGQWLSKAEGSVKPVDYPKLRVWKDKPLINALNALSGYKNRRLAVDSSVLLMKMGASPQKDSTVKLVSGLSVEDKRWFCIRMREDGMPEAAPVLKQLWGCKDRLVQTFILHYASRVNTTEAFRLAYDGYMDIPQTDLQFRSLALGAMASHITRVDADAKLAIPLMLDSYSKVDQENRQNFDSALSRAAGREPMSALSGDPTDVAKRLAEWKDWWAKQSK